MMKIKVSPEFGRGLYATRKIYAGELIEACEILTLSPADTVVVNTTDLKWYTFVFDEHRDCLVLGNGEIFNHSDDANVRYRLMPHKDRFMMVFISDKDIEEGEQLFIDYTADTKVDTSGYVGKNLI